MTPPTISEQIVQARQNRAPALREMMDACGTFRARLTAVETALAGLSGLETPDAAGAQDDLRRILHDLDELEERLRIRYDRFRKGLITVSIAGLEKAGKTTFLRSLTGIEALPAFDERCTAVSCELYYDSDRSDFDIQFYSEEEFLDRVLRPTLETVARELPPEERERLVFPSSAAAFMNLPLPTTDTVSGGTTAYKLLNDLRQLQHHFGECRRYLDSPPLHRRPLNELGEWVSHRQAQIAAEPEAEERGHHLARLAAARVCRIYAPFAGGSPHLRWIDTPGVDDPNRRARDLTLAAITEETDLLVVASRPGATPSPGESFHRFWDSVSRQPDEIDLMSRMLFALNWDKRVDPEGENVRIHQKYLTDAGVPRHLFVGPYEAIRPEDAAALMERVNEHLQAHLPDQDDQVVRTLETRLKNILARMRLLHNTLSGSHPSDAGLHDMETEAFHKWFHWYRGGTASGFWTDLVAALDRSTRDIVEDERIRESETSLNSIFAEEARQIQEQIPSPDTLDTYFVSQRGENPIPHGMRTLSIHFSRLVNRLASEVQEFGPIMQDRLVQVFTDAGLAPLLQGETAGEQLNHLVTRLKGNTGATAAENSVIEVLQETLELPRNLKYVIRYELRPAVDFCDPTLWNGGEDAWNRLTEMIRSNGGDPSRLAGFDSRKHPPVTESREKDHEILRRIAGNALVAVRTALGNERYLPRRIADDFMRDCRVRLCFSPEAEQEWWTLLFRNRGALLARTVGEIRARSERIQTFRQALNALEAALP